MKSVVICSSAKFRSEVHKFALDLEKLGVKVYAPPLDSPEEVGWNKLTDTAKALVSTGWTLRHFNKIAKAEIVFIYNKGGYAGTSVSMEIGYAVACSKPIIALENDLEPAREVLYESKTKTPKELVKLLQ